MNSSQRVFINTFAQYIRTAIVMLLSLYIVRVVLSSLGQSDYGIYTVVAGCVAMLGFLTNSLVRTTQRFVSFYQGKKDIGRLKVVFENCLLIHFFIGIFIVGGLELLVSFFFDGFLNIPEERLDAAVSVYHLVVAILFVTISTSPYRALLVSHENIVYISLIDIFDVVLKVVLVVLMSMCPYDKLIFYSIVLLCVQIFDFMAQSLYCYIKYEECIFPKFKSLQKEYISEMGKFAGWQIYGTACQIGREQGVSIVLNRVSGTIMNAGIGIGVQVSGATNMLSSAIVNAMSPQIVKAEGAGERDRTIWLSNILSKMVFFLMSILGVPFMFEIPHILSFWLEDYPDSAVFFCRMYILALMIDSLTIGLTHINNAIGNIGKYIVIMNTPKLFTIVFVIILMKLEAPILSVGIAYILIEGICAFVRIPLIKEQAGLDVKLFLKDVLLREIVPLLFCITTCLLCVNLFSMQYRFVLTFIFSVLVYMWSMYSIGLTIKERNIVNNLSRSVVTKYKRKTS